MSKKTLLITFLFFVLSSCSPIESSNNGSSNNNQNESKSSFDNSASNKEDKKYVFARRVYDLEYEPNGYKEESLLLQEFPDLRFERDASKTELIIEGRTNLESNIGAKGIYLADANGDGFVDLAFYQDRARGSSNRSYLVKVYDYQNDKFLFNDDNNKNSILDLDDEGTLLIEELGRFGSGFDELDRAGRFIKGETISFEWYHFDFKLKGMYIEIPNYKDGNWIAYINQTTNVRLCMLGIGNETMNEGLSLDSVNVKENSSFYTYHVTLGAIASQFNIEYVFLRQGTVELEISIGDIVAREKIVVLPFEE